MQHLSEEKLRRYVGGTLQEEEQAEVEEHFSECDDCFDSYLLMLESDSPLQSAFTDDTVERIVREHPTFQQKKETNMLAHYLVAAGFTLLLMMSGVFNLVTDSVDPDSFEQKPSFTEQIMDESSSLIDKIIN